MALQPGGTDLLIVDNSDQRWKVSTYLQEWCDISKSIDIATGNFEIGGLLALADKWQKVDQIRILMGDLTSLRTKQAFDHALLGLTRALDQSLEAETLTNNFLTGVPAIVDALQQGKIRCRVYRKRRFHAKAFITHARAEVVGAFALVGSSNLSGPGLTENTELNVQIVGPSVHSLQNWYEQHWSDAVDVTPHILRTIERHVAEYSPFDVYARALHEFFRGHQMTATEWETSHSRIFTHLDQYQRDAYWALMKIARQHGGAFLCDGVGLGKTFVGLQLIERLILHEGKRVVLFAPKAARESVWEPHLRQWLPHIGGVSGGADFSNLALFSHTDLGRTGEYPERFRHIARLANAIVIDEAHHFRNPGSPGDEDTGTRRSRYHHLYDLLAPTHTPKTVFMLTATPINNRLSDFRHMVELFTRRDETYFSRTLGIHNFRSYFNNLEKSLQERLSHDTPDVTEHITEAQDVLASDKTFSALVVQRSRSYARESQERAGGTAAAFPTRKDPQVAAYSIRKTYGRLLERFEKAFQRENPLFTLAVYYPLYWQKAKPVDESDKQARAFEENRQKQVVGLIRTQFLKRFESSVRAFEISCDRLLKKLIAFIEVHVETPSEKRHLARWKDQNSEIIGYVAQRQLDFDEYADDDAVSPELLAQIDTLSRDEYDVAEMMQQTYLDADYLVKFLDETRRFEARHDDKLQKLLRLLRSKELTAQKVLIFTEFADTARYLHAELTSAGVDGVAEVDSGTKADRATVIRCFSPYYNGSRSSELRGAEIRVLISTDVLSEGLNLQDACNIINYDIHWNPVRLMQRIGRVDRRLNGDVERSLLHDHPELQAFRGRVNFWNFLPPEELNSILTLYTRVTQKTLLISKTLGIEGRKLLTPDDDYAALKEFNQAYAGTKSVVEKMHLEYQDLLRTDPNLVTRLESLPVATFSGRKRREESMRGVFFCYNLPGLDTESNRFTDAAGTTRWYLADVEGGEILEDPRQIVVWIRSTPDTPRVCTIPKVTLTEVRRRVERHIRNTYLKRVQAPTGTRPTLRAWMELS
ncbi:MAG: helicase-related protein [Acidobacteria bacterium]|nr:helicase-related protein [Acidobacteriota bacterium]